MEIAGVAVDVPFLREISVRMEGELRALEQKIWAEAGEEFNVNSPVKLGQILFEKLGYPVLKKTAKTRTSLDGRRGPDRARGARLSRCRGSCSSSGRSRS